MRHRELALAMLIASAPGGARAGAGATGADFLGIGAGPRAVAMGGAFTALADDASALYWNPAGLSQLQQQEAAFSHAQWLNGFVYHDLRYAHPTKTLGAWAGSYTLLRKGSIPSYDENAAPLGAVSVSNSVATLGWGGKVMDRLSLGIGAKYVMESLAGYSASSYGADLGAVGTLYEDPFRKVSAGLAVRNVGKHGAFVAASEPLPRVIAFGLGFRGMSERLNAGLEGVMPAEESARVALGGEYWVHPLLAARAGYQIGADVGSGFSAGVGIHVRDVRFDYAFGDQGALGFTHRIGVSYRFGNAAARHYEEGMRLMRQGDYAEAFLRFNRSLNIDRENRAAMLRMKECRAHIQQELKQVDAVMPGAAPAKEKAP